MKKFKYEFDERSRDEWLYLIEQWIHDERDRAMVIRGYLDGISYEKIGEEFDRTANHCRERVELAVVQMFKHIKTQ